MNPSPLAPKPEERRSARFWSVFILALMAINLLVAVVAMVIAVGDPSFRPIPSYGEKSVDWETRKRMQVRSDSLGWTARVERGTHRDEIRIFLADRTGMPVTGAVGMVQAYHFTRAGEAVNVPAIESETQPGLYVAAVDVSKDGRWQIAVKLSRGENEPFLWDHDVEWYR